MATHHPFSLQETLQACRGMLQPGTSNDRPLRVMIPSGDGSYRVVPYNDQPYVAISYCWPSDGWDRLYSSSQTSQVATDKGVVSSAHFSAFIRAAVEKNNNALTEKVAVWQDQHCINQADGREKNAQVAIMQRIYFAAQCTMIMLDDVEFSADEFNTLKQSKTTDVHLALVRRLLRARWFTRAWCSQESVLSRRAIVCVHQTGKPDSPLLFNVDYIWQWLDVARRRDGTLPFFSEPRGSITDAAWTRMAKTSAWALGIVYEMGCYNHYDKVPLTNNLLRRIYTFDDPPEAFGINEPCILENVLKMVNVMAIDQRDFSLLLANSVQQNPLRGKRGFGWAGYPVRGDRIAEMWHPKDYEVARDPDIAVDATGLTARGIMAKIVLQHVWKLQRDSGGLHVSVDGVHKLVTSDWPMHDVFRSSRPHQLLRDFLYALEAFDDRGDPEAEVYSRAVYAYLLEEDYNYQPGPFRGDMKENMIQTFGMPSPKQRHVADALNFIHRDEGAAFSTVLLDEGTVLLVSGNVENMRNSRIFQPHVVRPKLFSYPLVITVNSMVLDNGNPHQCRGCVRGFGLISERSLGSEVRIKIT
ncbi:heterokaryon incompatibility protein-domain-containing protein [Sparassis latifolia]